MVLTVNPAEAQAIQEDEAQLLAAIAQAARGSLTLLLNQQPFPQPVDTLRIQMGRRIVYGQVGDREFRNELNSDQIKTIFDAVQIPVANGVDLSKYQGKVPAIEIRNGETTLFRQERDGTVTMNAIQIQLEQNPQQQDSGKDLVQPVGRKTLTEEPLINKTHWAKEVSQTADYLLNPLGAEQPIYDSVAIIGYHIKRDENRIVTISKGDHLILVTRDGEIVTDNITQQDWQTFQQIQERISPGQVSQVENAQALQEETEELLSRQYRNQYELWDDLERMTPDELLTVATKRFGLYSDGRNLAELEDRLLEQYGVIQDILSAYKRQNEANGATYSATSKSPQSRDRSTLKSRQNDNQVTLTADVAEATAPQDVLPAIAVAERETAKLPDGVTKQLLETTHQNWQQFRRDLDRGLRQSKQWLASRSTNWRSQRAARAALDLFNRGYDRTGERSYQVGEYTVSFKGQNFYILRDAKGELLRFRASKLAAFGVNWQRVQVVGISDRLGEFQCKELQSIQANKALIPQGNLDIEANYAAKTSRVEHTVVQFLQTRARANVWDKEGGAFRLEMSDGGSLRIIDKQEGRGIVFQRQNGEIFSKLNRKDFAHFDRLALRMQHTQQQGMSPQTNGSKTPQRSSGLELA